ncbi:hypothetical protein DRW41_03555 [Neobacillus piezotolerans]|uniref:Uncharacterized protein n=1 Tax=Neobacillus piezotolerans TaxID=2259171 RepID=A0A3D8GW14_9BACI|nr:hypothetical protein [Neobacillus piezotolerans]RDU38650.1 hypothetical protein DRW41_03555 [Neobacillus piezotolerans]
MESSKLIPLATINDEYKVWAGTRVRLYNVGLNIEEKKDDYYEYLVSFIYGNENFLQLTNLSLGEAGNILCVLEKDFPNQYALDKNLKYMMGLENTFILID